MFGDYWDGTWKQKRSGSHGPTGKGYVIGATRRGPEKMAQWVDGAELGAQFFLCTALDFWAHF